MDNGSEQRRNPRWMLRTTAKLTFGPGQVTTVRTFDVSVGGVSVICQSTVPIGSTLQISFLLPPATGGRPIPLSARAKVIGCIFDSRSSGFRVSMQFLEIDAAAKTVIENRF